MEKITTDKNDKAFSQQEDFTKNIDLKPVY
jgi:hypothetical protein